MTKLKKAFVEASVNRNTKLQETVVLTIGQLGRMAKGDLLHVVVISLLDNLAAQSQLIRAIAFEQVQYPWVNKVICICMCYMYVCMCVCVCMYVCVCVCMCVCMYVCSSVSISAN